MPELRLVVIGATGRIGRALQRRVGCAALRGLARHAPVDSATWADFVQADRRDHAALLRLLDGADVIIDLCAFEAPDSDALVRAWAACARRPRLLILASSLAERSPARWATPIDPQIGLAHEPPPSDAYGLGKRAARTSAETGLSALGAHVITLLLPQVLATDDRDARERRYLDDAQRLGHAQLAGDGQQRPCVITADDAATVMVALAGDAATATSVAAPIERFQVAPPVQPRLDTLVAALLTGAGLPTQRRPHPDADWRGPHSGADELVDGTRLRQRLAASMQVAPQWSDLLRAHGELGRRLAAATHQALQAR